MVPPVIEHVHASGDEQSDAEWVRILPKCWKQRELWRLERIYGAGHRWNVERLLKMAPGTQNKTENARGLALERVGVANKKGFGQ